jgi:hypothetical protein
LFIEFEFVDPLTNVHAIFTFNRVLPMPVGDFSLANVELSVLTNVETTITVFVFLT